VQEVQVVLAAAEVVKVVQVLLHIVHHKEIPVDLVVMVLLHILLVVEEVVLEDQDNQMVPVEMVELEFRFLQHSKIQQLLQAIHQILFHLKEVVV
jgi:hypothetical protein